MNIDESRTSVNFTPHDQVPAVYGMARNIASITIHHWGELGQDFDTVTNFLCNNSKPTSAHFVVEDGRVACLVAPADAAWHAGNAEGNATSIGIECRPEATDGDYGTVAELVRYLRTTYGADLPLYPHSHWYNTACPGVWDLNRIDSLARSGIAAQGTITPTTQEDDMATVPQQEWEAIKQQIASLVDNVATKTDLKNQAERTPVEVWSYKNPGVGGGDAYQILRDAVSNTNRIASDIATVAAKAAVSGATEEQIKEAVKAAIAESIVTVDVNVGGK